MKTSIEQRLRDLQHFGEEGGVVPVIDVAATSTFLNPEDMARTFQGELPGCYLYSRHSNPTVKAFSAKIAALEGTEAALGVSSGMAAITASLLQLLRQGDHLISSRVVYGGTYALFENLLPRFGIEVSFVDLDDEAALAAAVRPGRTKVLYAETMSNPMLTISDLPRLARFKEKHGLKLVIDNTFAPLMVSPARFGADVVVHSATKFLSGAADMIAGAVAGPRAFVDSLVDVNHGAVMLTGPVMDPRTAHELYLRLDHLPLRVRAHSAAALDFASFAEKLGVPTIYPGLASHPHHARLREIANPGFGFGGMVTIDCGDPKRALALAKQLQDARFGLYAVSLGFSRTLMSCPAVSTSSEIPEDKRRAMKLHEGLLRLSIGFTGHAEEMHERFAKAWKAL